MRTKYLLVAASLWVCAFLGVRAGNAQCPYSSVQLRVQINTSTPWSTSTLAVPGTSVHIGVFRNGSGLPIDHGGVIVYALQGSYYQVLSLNGWDTNWRPGVTKFNDPWSFEVFCGGAYKDSANVIWGGTIDPLQYILPNYPSSNTGSPNSVNTNKTNYWRTYANAGGSVGERLPGFFITKGVIDYAWSDPAASTTMWNFEEMIYDSQWIYLVRDTSWDRLCANNNHVAGQLLFTYEGGVWLRGGRHFPRAIADGGTVDTGQKYVQGVQRATGHTDTAGEGAWCSAQNSGWTSSQVYAEFIGRQTLGNRTFDDVLKLRIVGGSGTNDEWWFARGTGMIRFADGTQLEQHASTNFPFPVTVRIPCYPGAPCF